MVPRPRTVSPVSSDPSCGQQERQRVGGVPRRPHHAHAASPPTVDDVAVGQALVAEPVRRVQRPHRARRPARASAPRALGVVEVAVGEQDDDHPSAAPAAPRGPPRRCAVVVAARGRRPATAPTRARPAARCWCRRGSSGRGSVPSTHRGPLPTGPTRPARARRPGRRRGHGRQRPRRTSAAPMPALRGRVARDTAASIGSSRRGAPPWPRRPRCRRSRPARAASRTSAASMSMRPAARASSASPGRSQRTRSISVPTGRALLAVRQLGDEEVRVVAPRLGLGRHPATPTGCSCAAVAARRPPPRASRARRSPDRSASAAPRAPPGKTVTPAANAIVGGRRCRNTSKPGRRRDRSHEDDRGRLAGDDGVRRGRGCSTGQPTSTTSSTSTGASSGSTATPTAVRAWAPASPKTCAEQLAGAVDAPRLAGEVRVRWRRSRRP